MSCLTIYHMPETHYVIFVRIHNLEPRIYFEIQRKQTAETTFTEAVHGTNTRDKSDATANCMFFLLWNRKAS